MTKKALKDLQKKYFCGSPPVCLRRRTVATLFTATEKSKPDIFDLTPLILQNQVFLF